MSPNLHNFTHKYMYVSTISCPSLVYDKGLDQVYPDKVLDEVYMTLVVNQPRAL